MPPKKSANPKSGAPKGKAKAPKVNRAVEQLKKIQELKRKQDEAQRRAEEREKAKRELERLQREKEEEEKRQELAKKEREKVRKKEHRTSKADRAEEERKRRAQEDFKLAGIYIAGMEEQAEKDKGKPTMTDAQKRRLQKQQREQAEKRKEEEQAKREALKAEQEKAAAAAAEEEEDDDWEKLLSDGNEEQKEEEEESESEQSDLPMDDESILQRHYQRMRKTITRTIRHIQAAQKESASTIASVSISSTQHAAASSSSADSDSDEEEQTADGKLPLRSPIVCILGHVDVGKTKILDKLRQTNVQTGEAGGITQQIGATFFPVENIRHALRQAEKNIPASNYDRVPGLLIIDTPGHESFSNLRSRGSSMCNLAILVVDIMHSLEPQTLESLQMILNRKVPFVIALNKIDVLTGWVPSTARTPDGDIDHSFETALNAQSPQVRGFFQDRLQLVLNDLAAQGVNAALYTDKDKDFSDYVRIVPTSAKTGEGLPDLLANLLSIGQNDLEEEIRVKPELQATVMEIKTITGLGTTADIILANGTLSEGDTIVVCGTEGPIVSQIRSLLTPHPMKEIRVKTEYLNHKSIMASIGVKVCAAGLENALAGSDLHVIYDPEEEEVLKDKISEEFDSILGSFDREEAGTYVVASTVGSLEALVTYLKSLKTPIPIANVSVGPVHKRDVMKAAVMLEKNPRFAVILAFDVPIDDDAYEEADKQNVQIFRADIIYRLTEQFDRYLEELAEAEEQRRRAACIYPARLSVIRCFHDSDPVIVGVHVDVGRLGVGAPVIGLNLNKALIERLRVKGVQAGMSATQAQASATEGATREAQVIELGIIESIEKDKVPMKFAEKGAEVAIKIGRGKNAVPQFGKKFTEETIIITKYDRASIDYIKEKQKELFDVDPQLRQFVVTTRGLLGIAPPTKAQAPPAESSQH